MPAPGRAPRRACCAWHLLRGRLRSRPPALHMNATSSLARLPFPSPASLALFALVLMAAGRLPAEDSPSGDISFPPRSADFVPWRQQFYAYNLRTCGDIFRTTADHGQPWAKTAAHVHTGARLGQPVYSFRPHSLTVPSPLSFLLPMELSAGTRPASPAPAASCPCRPARSEPASAPASPARLWRRRTED